MGSQKPGPPKNIWAELEQFFSLMKPSPLPHLRTITQQPNSPTPMSRHMACIYEGNRVSSQALIKQVLKSSTQILISYKYFQRE
jgi:hypothetical protein